ncbi:hypothetical protein F4802DRAFT_592459 [Xylaria palmicola]|nr:hypothetical protein F4802DRAFT_592459 [Xylaria palmicola]
MLYNLLTLFLQCVSTYNEFPNIFLNNTMQSDISFRSGCVYSASYDPYNLAQFPRRKRWVYAMTMATTVLAVSYYSP